MRLTSARRSALVGTTALAVSVVLASLTPIRPGLAAPSRAELEAAQARLLEIEKEFELVVEEYNLVNERLHEIQTSMAEKELVVSELESRMRVKEGSAVALAIELYKAGPGTLAVESVLSSGTIAELETRLQYLRSSNEAQAKVFEELGADRALFEAELAELEEAKGQALRAQTRIAELKEEIEQKLVLQEDEIAQLNQAIMRAEARREARLAAALARATTGVVAVGGIPARPAPAPNPQAQTAVDAALSQQGKPYQWGAEGPDSYDCSGLTLWAWAKAGVSLPHNSGMQYNATPRVARSDWAPGDLLFFGSPIHHVAMYIGNGQMVEAPYSGNAVRVVPASRSDYVGAGRPGV